MSKHSYIKLRHSFRLSCRSSRNVQYGSTISCRSSTNVQYRSTISWRSSTNVQYRSTISWRSSTNVQYESTVNFRSTMNTWHNITLALSVVVNKANRALIVTNYPMAHALMTKDILNSHARVSCSHINESHVFAYDKSRYLG